MTIAIIIGVVLVIIVVLVLVLKSKKGKEEETTTQESPRTPSQRPAPRQRPAPVAPSKQLPEANYPRYDHSRMITTLGLSEDDAIEFIGDLITQIDTTIPRIQSAINASDIEELEQQTHSIKGSATNLGTGGVASLLIDFNTYLKTQTDMDIINKYFEHLKHYTQELKIQYS